MIADHIKHRGTCPGADPQPITGDRWGDQLYRCQGCGRFGLTPAAAPSAHTGATPAQSPRPATRPLGATLDHAPECSRPAHVDTTLGRFGNALARCPECRRSAPLTRLAPTKPGRGPVVAVVSRYVCPVHYEAVTWKGTGCPNCADERRAREAARELERKARVRVSAAE